VHSLDYVFELLQPTTGNVQKLTAIQDRPCARCVKRSIGHLCHDEPRESTRGPKHSQEESGATVKQEDSLPYMLGPSIDQQQAGEHMLQEARTTLGSRSSNSQTIPAQILQQSPDPFANNDQQCERQARYICALSLHINFQSPRLQ